MAVLDATQIVDRDEESKQFAAMLRRESVARVLVVSAGGGSGKSALLQKLSNECTWEHEVPVALIDFAEFQDKPDEWSIIEGITSQLRNGKHHLVLPEFDRLDTARSLQDRSAFGANLGSAIGTVDVRGNVTGGSVTGMVVGDHATIDLGGAPWTDETERLARQQCREAFIADLAGLDKERRAVLIFDSVEKAGGQVRIFLLEQILARTLVGDGSSPGLFGVLAGKELLSMVEGRLAPAERKLVATAALQQLGREHVAELLRVHDYEPDDVHVNSILVLIQGGRPLQEALIVAEVLCRKRDD